VISGVVSRAWSYDGKLRRTPMTPKMASGCPCLIHDSSNILPDKRSNPYATGSFADCTAGRSWYIVLRRQDKYGQVGQVVDG